MDYNHKTIRIDKAGEGTIAIMEWIRDNGCPDLCHTDFIDKHNNCIAMVSKSDESMFSATLEALDIGLYKWFEYKGMKRHRSGCGCWLFLIDGNYYWATR